MHVYTKIKQFPAICTLLVLLYLSLFHCDVFSLYGVIVIVIKEADTALSFIRTCSRRMTLKCVRKHRQANDHEDVISLY